MEVVSYPRRDDVRLISLDPPRGSEIKMTVLVLFTLIPTAISNSYPEVHANGT